MLALAADDCEQRLLLSGADDGDAKGARITAGLLALKEDGSLEVKALPPANKPRWQRWMTQAARSWQKF